MKILSLILILICQSFTIFSQETKIVEKEGKKLRPNSMTFLNVGYAFGRNFLNSRNSGSIDDIMIFVNLSLNHVREDNIYSLRTVLGTNFGFLGGNSVMVSEMSAMYGIVNKAKFGYTAISAGLGYVSITRNNYNSSYTYGYDSYSDREASTVGLVLEAQAFGNLFVVGLGMNAFVNLNTELIYGGIGIQLQFGDLMNEYYN